MGDPDISDAGSIDAPGFHEQPGEGVLLTVMVSHDLLNLVHPGCREDVLEEAQKTANLEVGLVVAIEVLDIHLCEIASKVPVALSELAALGLPDGFIPSDIMSALARLYGDGFLDEEVRLSAIRTGAGRSIRERILGNQLTYIGSSEDRLQAIQNRIDYDPENLTSYRELIYRARNNLVTAYNSSTPYSRSSLTPYLSGGSKGTKFRVWLRVVTEADFIGLMDNLGHLVALATLTEEERASLSYYSN